MTKRTLVCTFNLDADEVGNKSDIATWLEVALGRSVPMGLDVTVWDSPADFIADHGWNHWTGDALPPVTKDRIDYRMRNGETVIDHQPSGLDWRHQGFDSDIVAWRPTDPTKRQLALAAAAAERPISLAAALVDIVGKMPPEKPEEEDYDDTEAAYNNGMEVALWDTAQIALAALYNAGLTTQQPYALQEATCRAAWLAAGYLIDEEAEKAGEWAFYFVDTLDDDDLNHDPRAIQKGDEWRVYFEDAFMACADCAIEVGK